MTLDSESRLEISRRAVEQLEAERERLEGLLLRLPSLVAELDPDRLAAGMTEAARELAGARFGLFVHHGDSPGPGPAGWDGASMSFVGLDRKDFAEPPNIGRAEVLAGVLLGQGSVRIDDATVWAPSESTARAYGVLADGRLVRSWLAAPVWGRRGETLAAVYLGHHRAHAFSARHEELVAGLCHQLGVALEHATLFAERGRVATALQESLLPPLLPEVPGVDVAARYRATGAGNLVGGDFYDVFESGAGEWGLVLGDVSGFGPEAAAVTGVARYTVRAVAGTAGGPSDVLRRLNQAVLNLNSTDRFLTAVYGSVKPEDGRISITLSSGGHPPGLVLRDDETVEVLDRATGTLLGAFDEVTLEDRQLTLGSGDALVLFTDGVLEARDEAGTEFGLERLESLLATCAGRSAEGIARRIERAVLDHRGDRTEDDVAIVVLRARP